MYIGKDQSLEKEDKNVSRQSQNGLHGGLACKANFVYIVFGLSFYSPAGRQGV
jgi:hypothetical protein